MSALPRTYVCPQCGYDGFRSGPLRVTGFTDANVQFGCPQCMTLHGGHVVLEETSDPRRDHPDVEEDRLP